MNATPYTNPIIPGYAPDPSIVRVGADYYLVNSSFESFPGVPVYHSQDLVNWKLIGYALTRDSQLPLEKAQASEGGIWAGTIRYHNGAFYMITKNQTVNKHFYVTAADPAGPWSEPIWLPDDWSGHIDPDIFFDADGSAYLTKPQGAGERTLMRAWLVEDPATGTLGRSHKLWWGEGYGYEEGPHLYRIGEYYYVLVAEGGTGDEHRVTIARRPAGEGLGQGPEDWEPCPHNPIVFNDPTQQPEIYATGHGDLVEDHQGNWWIVFLGRRCQPLPDLGRETYLAPVTWQDGWPVVNNGQPITLEMEGPTLPPHPWEPEPVRDEFDGDTLGLEWNFLRNPDPSAWSLTERPGALTLHGNAMTLKDEDALAWVGRRQRDKACRVETVVDFVPQAANEVAGLVSYSTPEGHAEFVVTRRDGQRALMVRYNSDTVVANTALASDKPVQLRITMLAERAQFDYSVDGGTTWTTLHQDSVRNVVRPIRYTGAYVALYASGNGSAATAPAAFDWFEYEGLNGSADMPATSGTVSASTKRVFC